MAISTISPQSKIQGLTGTSRLVFSKKAISQDFFAVDASLYSNQTATYYLNPGTYGLVAASKNTNATIKIYQNTKSIFFSTTFANDSAITKYITIPEDANATENEYNAINIYYPRDVFENSPVYVDGEFVTNDSQNLAIKSFFFTPSTNRIFSSTDNITWTTTVIAEAGYGLPGFFLNNEFVIVVAGKRTMYTSTDTVNWSSYVPISLSTNSGLSGIAYGNSAYVIATGQAFAAFSTNKVTWTTVAIGNEGLESIIFANGVFIVTTQNRQWQSTNGITWTTSSNQQLDSLYYENNKIIGVRDARTTTERPRIYESTNGIIWTTRAVINFSTSIEIYSMKYFEKTGKYYINTNRPLSVGGHPLESTDLITWTTIDANPIVFITSTNQFSVINYFNDKLFIGDSFNGIVLDTSIKPISVQLFKAVD